MLKLVEFDCIGIDVSVKPYRKYVHKAFVNPESVSAIYEDRLGRTLIRVKEDYFITEELITSVKEKLEG